MSTNHFVPEFRTKDTGTLQYDWFLSADGRESVVRERYRDSPAAGAGL